jgi:PAN domain
MIMRSTLGSLYRHTLLLFALVACALLTLALLPARAHVSTEWGIDRKGGDIPGKKFVMPNAAECAKSCNGDAQCKAYTYVYPGVLGPKGLCFLKDSVPDPIADGCCISGVKNG